MTPLFPAHRAAEEFAGVLDGSRADVADRYADLTATVTLLRAQPEATPRPDFVADLRERLMLAADDILQVVPRETPRTTTVVSLPTRTRQRFGKAAAIAVVVAGTTTGMAVAAQGSLPGESLYPVKRGLESAQTHLNFSDAGRGSDLLAQASTRASEVDALADRNTPAREITDTLESFQKSAGHGSDLLFTSYLTEGDPADIATVRSFTADALAALTKAAANAPKGTRDAFAAATSLLADIETQARTLCGSCGGTALGAPVPGDSAALSLHSLIAQPVIVAQHDADVRAAQEQKQLEQQAADVKAPTTTTAPKPRTTTDSSPTTTTKTDTTAPVSGGAVEGTVKQVTGTVTGLLDSVSAGTGGLTTPLTDSVNQTLTSLTDTLSGVTGLLP